MKLAWTGALLFAISIARAAYAEPPLERAAPVVVLIARENDEFGLRLGAELRSIGMKVVMRRKPSHASPDGTVAIVTVVDQIQRRVEIRMGNHPSLAAEPDVVVTVDAGGALETVQAAERVRAAFEPLAPHSARGDREPGPAPAPAGPTFAPALPEGLPPREVRDPGVAIAVPAPSPAVPAPLVIESSPALGVFPERNTPRAAVRPRASEPWAFGFGAGAGAMFGSQGPSFETSASFFFSPLPWFRIEPFVVLPVLPATVEGDAGTADLYAGIVALRAGFRVLDAHVLSLELGASAGGMWMRAVGHPATDYVGSTEDALTFALMADLTPRIHLYGPLWLAPRATIGIAAPAPIISFAGTEIDHLGLPLGGAHLGVEVQWPMSKAPER